VPGVRYPVFLNGEAWNFSPSEWSEAPLEAKTEERLRYSRQQLWRPYIPGGPDTIVLYVWTLKWPPIESADYDRFSDLAAEPGFVPLCSWRRLTERFTGTGSRTQFRLRRRDALRFVSPLPPGAISDTALATQVTVDGVPASPTFAGGLDADGFLPFTLGSAPALGSVVRVRYVPLHEVSVTSRQTTLGIPQLETPQLVLTER
jgi:hypothetical protein